MKILFIIDDLNSGGAQRQMINLILFLKNEFSIEVIVAVYHENEFSIERLLSHEIEVIKIYENNYFIRIYKFIKLIKDKRFSHVISFLLTPNFINIISSFFTYRYKIIVNERSANPQFNLKYYLYRTFYMYSDNIISNSYSNIHLIKKNNFFLKFKKYSVIYNSLDLQKFIPLKDYRFREKGIINLLILARHESLKNLKGLIFAFNDLTCDEKSNFEINWYGEIVDNSYIEGIELINKFQLEKYFRFHKPVKDVIQIIQNSDVIGLFSKYEGFPNSICEGMACGKPIICSNVSDLQFIMENQTQFLFNPNITSDISNVLKILINLNQESMEKIGKTNRMIAEKKFDSNFNNVKYSKIILE